MIFILRKKKNDVTFDKEYEITLHCILIIISCVNLKSPSKKTKSPRKSLGKDKRRSTRKPKSKRRRIVEAASSGEESGK